MKRLICIILCLCLALASGGCAKEPAPQETTLPTTAQVPTDSPTEPSAPEFVRPKMHAVILPPVSETVTADDGTALFIKNYQHIQMILTDTDVDDIITADLQARLSVALYDAADIEAAARSAYQPGEAWNPYLLEVLYTPTRIDGSVLSLFGNILSYRGGIHPSPVTESITYDLATASSLTLGDILTGNADGNTVCQLIVEALAPRAETDLYGDYEEVLQERFGQNYESYTSWYFSRTGLCFHFSPYDIAPYSSGTIVAEIPYEKLTDVIKEKYLNTQQPVPTGSMYASSFVEDDGERFICIADVELSPNGRKILIHPDDTVTDVRIETGSWSSDGSRYIPTATVFAAGSIELGNAIVITAGLAKTDPVLRLVYRSGELEVSAIVTYDPATDDFLLVHG